MPKLTVKRIAMVAILLAMQIVLSRYLSITTPVNKIAFSFIPIVFALRYLGIIDGVIVGGLGDMLGAIMFPVYPYFPGYTLTAVVRAIILGLCIHKKVDLKRISLGIVATELICSVGMNTYWNAFLSEEVANVPIFDVFVVMLPARLIQSVVMIVVQILVLYILLVKNDKTFKKILKSSDNI